MRPTEKPAAPESIEGIYASSLPPLEKLARAFGATVEGVVAETLRRVELARAMGDGEEVVKQEIKGSTMTTALRLFESCRERVERAPKGER